MSVERRPNALIGRPIERTEDLRFLRGRGQYVADVFREGMLHAVILRSSVPHGRLRGIDAGAALAITGVRAVITAHDLGPHVPLIPLRLQPLSELEPFQQPVLAFEKVRYVGEPLAVVIADTQAIAEDALEHIGVDIEPLEPVTGRVDAELPRAVLFKAHGSNQALTWTGTRGDVDAAFAHADFRRRERFTVQRYAALFMEPRGFVAEWDEAAGRLTVWGAAKVAHTNRRILAKQIGLPESAIDMIEVDVGGGFGSRGEFYPEDFLIPFCARHLRRPIKWIEDRREHLMCANHARDAEIELEIAATKDGRILGLRGEAVTDHGAYLRTNGSVAPRNIAQFITGPYRIEHVAMVTTMLVSNKTPAGTYRGPGRYEGDFARERLIDMMARDLGLDRVEVRRRNLVADAEMPWPLPDISPYESPTELDSGDNHALLEQCLAVFGWGEKAKLSGKLIEGRYHGVALGCFIEGGAAGPKEDARIVLERDGTYSVYVGSAAVGQGIETIMAQIAGDALEVAFDKVRILHGSSAHVAEGFGSYHSRSTVMGGGAILVTAEALRAKIRDVAAPLLGCASGEVVCEGDCVRAPSGRSLNVTELPGLPIEAAGTFYNKKYTYACGSQCAHVAVDAATGEIEVLSLVSIKDVGRMINPLTLKGQAVGSIVQGLGGTLLEHIVYDRNGELLTGSLADYLMPAAGSFPRIEAMVVEMRPSPYNPLGAKGGGEGEIIPVGGVIANAVADALSSLCVEPRDLPLSPPRVWALINPAER